MGIQIALVRCDNWQGLYVSEKLVWEDHSIGIPIVMAHVLHEHVDHFEQYNASDTWLGMVGSFTPSLRDVVLEDGRTIAEHWKTE